jgi:DNA-binding response OmpR family regulator
MKILIVEDDKDLCEIEAEILKLEGHSFDVAQDGETAIKKLSPDFDLILLDLMLPKVSGLEVLAVIRADPSLADQKVIIVTAIGREIDKEVLCDERTSILRKPFRPEELISRIREAEDSDCRR